MKQKDPSTEHKILIDGLIETASLSPKAINEKKALFATENISPANVKEYVDKGWEVVPSNLKTKVKVRKEKLHSKAFEDRVWALFAKMKLTNINASDQFKLAYGKGLSKQIDVFACDNESVLVIECKSAAKKSSESFQKDIHEIALLKEKLRATIRASMPGEPKVAFIFATRNIALSGNDVTRLQENSIVHFSQDTINYYEQLTDQLGEAAKYQLFGSLFAGLTIPNLATKVPAIKGKLPSGRQFYSFCIDPKVLLQLSFVLHRSDASKETINAYQRLVKKSRLAQISKYIDGGGYFPNSIIINIQEKDIKFEPAARIKHDSKTDFGILHLPQKYKTAFIIDGQHRLFGYAISTVAQNHTIPVVAFHNLPEEEQTQIFVDINHSQKSVPTNLLHSLMADFHWDSSNDKLAIGALKTRLFAHLNADEKSPFYHRVVLAEEPKSATRCLTLQTIKSWGLAKSNFFGKFKGDKLISYGFLTDSTHSKTLDKALDFFITAFSKIESELLGQWELGSAEGGFISMNIGVSATIQTLNCILENLESLHGIQAEKLDGKQLAVETFPYLAPVIDFVKSLDHEGIKKLRSLFGSGATEKVLREFQYAIHQKFDDFNPDGLAQWIKESSGKYNKLSEDVGKYSIEPLMHAYIVSKLKHVYGEKLWWDHGVPKEIQKKCSIARIESGTGEPDWNYLHTIYYFDIISKDNWSLLGEAFTEPGKENASKQKKLVWLVKFNQIRQKYSHPQRENISEDEYSYLLYLNDWLTKKLKDS